METHVFKLLTGVECEIRNILGEDQEVFTSQKNIKDGTFINKFLKAIITRIGSKTNITNKDIDEMLSGDRRLVMLEIRNFENDFDTNFEFNYKFSSDGKTLEHPVKIDFAEVERKPYTLEDGTPIDCKEYSEVLELKKQKVLLPKSNQVIYFEFLDGAKEFEILKHDKTTISVLTDLKIRKPTYTKDGNTFSLDLAKQRGKDLGILRKAIKSREGDIDTMVRFIDPYSSNQVTFDAMHVTDFLFPDIT